jgi:hypothetical protein
MAPVRLARPNGHFPPINEKVCEHCGEVYPANSGRQRWCPTCVPAKRHRRRMQRYQLTPDAFQAMLDAQGGICPLCQERPAKHVDHDHATGRVRGILCNACNVSLHALDRPGWLSRAQEYIADAVQIGKAETIYAFAAP